MSDMNWIIFLSVLLVGALAVIGYFAWSARQRQIQREQEVQQRQVQAAHERIAREQRARDLRETQHKPRSTSPAPERPMSPPTTMRKPPSRDQRRTQDATDSATLGVVPPLIYDSEPKMSHHGHDSGHDSGSSTSHSHDSGSSHTSHDSGSSGGYSGGSDSGSSFSGGGDSGGGGGCGGGF